MNKKAFFVLVSAMIIMYIIYRIVMGYIGNAVDNANKRGIEEYVETIRLEYIRSVFDNRGTINIDNINTNVKIDCEEKNITSDGIIELHGCRVENSKRKYGYVNDKVQKE